MAVYLISYDLKAKPEAEYTSLGQYLGAIGALRILYSEWVVALSGTNPSALCDAVVAHVEPNDHVWVLPVGNGSFQGSLASTEAIRKVFANV